MIKAKLTTPLVLIGAVLLTITICAEVRTLDTPTGSYFKSYMDYEAITNKNSEQYKMQQQAETDPDGCRVYNNRYCVAMGSYYSKQIGTPIDVTLDTGVVIPCVLGDAKNDIHTNATHQVGSHNDVVEFIVDVDNLDSEAKRDGTLSSIPKFKGNVVEVTVLDEENAIVDEDKENIITYDLQTEEDSEIL